MLCSFGTTCCLYHQRSVPANKKDVLPTFQQSDVIYQFSCYCDSWYVGRISQRLQDRIKQHSPKTIRNAAACSQTRMQPKRDCKSSTHVPTTQSLSCDSVIGLHVLRNPICAQNYDDKHFHIFSKGRSSFYLSVLEAVFIKTLNLILCRQKEFIYNLTLLSYKFFVLNFPAHFI